MTGSEGSVDLGITGQPHRSLVAANPKSYFTCLGKPGAVAQLGERHNGIVEAVGSIPTSSICSTKNPVARTRWRGFAFANQAFVLGVNRVGSDVGKVFADLPDRMASK